MPHEPRHYRMLIGSEFLPAASGQSREFDPGTGEVVAIAAGIRGRAATGLQVITDEAPTEGCGVLEGGLAELCSQNLA